MKKKIYFLSILTILCCLLSSCNKDKIRSFSDLKKDQKKAIQSLITERNLKVKELKTDKLPSPIDTEVYYHLPNGLYIRVLAYNPKGEKAKKGQEYALAFKGYSFDHKQKEIQKFDNYSRADKEFTYFEYTHFYRQGDIHFQLIKQDVVSDNIDHYMCEGLAYPLTLVEDGAYISLIIPFELGPEGTYKDGLSLFVEEAKYNKQ